jgi:hypothetical protein
MIRIDIHPRLVRTVRSLGPEVTGKVEETLTQIAQAFGDPHRHSGLGIRKLGRRSYEVRVWLQWRIVLIKEPDRLTAYDLMDHEGVGQWLRRRKGT